MAWEGSKKQLAYKRKYAQEHAAEIAAYQREYRIKNKVKLAAQAHEYNLEHRDKISARNKIYREGRRDDIAAYKQTYHQENKSKILAWHKEYRLTNKAGIADQKLRHKYGIGTKERDKLLEQQGGVCPLCLTNTPSKKGWVVDHCHVTNKVRGILCQNCNTMLGMSSESIDTLLRAIEYIKKHKND